MKFENTPQSGFPNESLCDVIKLGIPFERNLVFLWRILNLSEHKYEEDMALMKNEVHYSI